MKEKIRLTHEQNLADQTLLLVCSTTLWVGQLDKKTQQSDVMSVLEEFGQISSINVSLSFYVNKHISLCGFPSKNKCVVSFALLTR